MDNERIKSIRDYLKMNQTAFSAQMGMPQAHLSEIENGKKAINKKILYGIAIKYPEINIRWILTGEGEMTRNKNTDEIPVQTNNNIGNKNSNLFPFPSHSPEYEFLQKIIADKDSHIADLRRSIALLEKSLMGK
jgi:transcriptional regulator with XRE-family HTH domain